MVIYIDDDMVMNAISLEFFFVMVHTTFKPSTWCYVPTSDEVIVSCMFHRGTLAVYIKGNI